MMHSATRSFSDWYGDLACQHSGPMSTTPAVPSMEDLLRRQLITTAQAFEAASGTTMPTIGRRALNDNTLLARLAAGQGFTVKTYDRLMAWLSDNWPDGAQWPADVPRPNRSGDSGLAAQASRLRAARRAAGFASARSAALQSGWVPSTYGAHENGQNSIPGQIARVYADTFGVSAGWLLFGECA